MPVKFPRELELIFTFLPSWFNDFEVQSILPKSNRQSYCDFFFFYLLLVGRCAVTSWVWCFVESRALLLPPSLQKYKEYEKDVAIEEIDGLQLVKKLAKNMEEMFHKKSEAVRVSASAFCSVSS